MGAKTDIEWTHFFGPARGATWNPFAAYNMHKRGWVCRKKTSACLNCYAEALNKKRGTGLPYDAMSAERVSKVLMTTGQAAIDWPLTLTKRYGIFLCSMTDWLESIYPSHWVDLALAVMSLAKIHVFVTLTKNYDAFTLHFAKAGKPTRLLQLGNQVPSAVDRWLRIAGDVVYHPTVPSTLSTEACATIYWPPPNVFFGVTVGDQHDADKIFPVLNYMFGISTGIKVVVSYEPALGPIKWYGLDRGAIRWLIAGPETGTKRRPCDLDNLRAARDYATRNNIPFFLKRDEIDGVTWKEFPTLEEQ